MITKTDKKIILELQKKGRASYAELASKLGISVSTVASRTERLIHSRVIEIRAIPNPYKMGLIANALIAVKAEPSKVDRICDRLVDNFFISTVTTVFGRYDILIIVHFPTWELMHDFINRELSRIDGVLRVESYYLNKFKKRYQSLFVKDSSVRRPIRLKESEKKLIEELAKNGRKNIREIAEKIGTHVSTVSRRIHALVEEDVFKIVAVPNPQSFGYGSNAFISLDVEATKVDQICKDLFSYPEIVVITTLVNGSGIMLGIQTTNNEMLYRFIKEKIAHIKGVQETETFVTAELKKRYYGWYLE
jgi:Lrp/AsnC family transcriptional regulator, regulator for asnA, asnC and gidA